MDANSFIITLKADGSESDVTDLQKFLVDLKKVLSTSPSQNRGQIALNALSILCRNLDKVPSWCEKIDYNAFLTLCIECIRETRGMDKAGQVKTLACIQHIHKYIVAQKNVPPVYVLKLSYMPFECNKEKLLKEYSKTYWDILANRLVFLEKLKNEGVNLTKLLKKCTEDIQIVIMLYDTEQFCKIILLYLVRKLYFLYSGNTKEFNVVCAKIFEFISKKKDLQSLNRLSEKDSLVLYRVFNECIYVIVDNSTKISFEESPLSSVTKYCITILEHNNFMVQCLETIYLNALCVILSNKTNANIIENALTNLLKHLQIKRRVGHEKVFATTYPFLAQLLRLYMEFVTTNHETLCKGAFVNQILDACLNLMLFLMVKSRKTELLTKCVGCTVKSGIHDGWRLSLSAKSLIDISLTKAFDLTNSLQLYYKFVKEQYSILDELYKLKCANFKKYFRKLQTDIHNIAIGLNNSKYYDCSIKLFDIYIKVDIQRTSDAVNISRGFFNKSICELDRKLYESALRDAFLSFVFSQPDGQMTNKYTNLILDIKSRAVKDPDSDLDKDFQMITVLDSCKSALEQNLVPKGLLGTLKFSALLKLEFSMYAKLWPSMVPIAGVWRSLYDLASGIHDYWVSEDESQEALLWSLYEIILETPTIVRTIHNDIYKQIVTDLLERYEESMEDELKIVFCTLMFLKAEYDLADASQEYNWKVERNMFLEDYVTTRTVVQEQTAIQQAVKAVEILTDVIKRINSVKNVKIVGLSLKTIQIFVMQLLYLSNLACALQLASVCCRLAALVGDEQTYIRNAGTILYHSSTYHHGSELLLACGNSVKKLMQDKNTLQTALVFICDAAIFHTRCGQIETAAKLVRLVQGKILLSEKLYGDVNLQIATGRLLEAQSLLCTDSGLSPMSSAMCVQRDYLSISGVGEIWCDRHLESLTVKRHSVASGAAAVRLWRGAGALRRARACAAGSLPRANAAATARLLAAVTDAASVQHAQPTIDNRLKYLLNLQTDAQITQITPPKRMDFTPKVDVFETALQCRRQREPTSPTQSYLTIPAFKTPDCIAKETCVCRACETPEYTLLTLQTLGLQASVHFRTNEFHIANNHFEGVLKTFPSVDKKVAIILKKYKNFDANILDIVKKTYESESKMIQLEILMEAAFFKLSQKSHDEAEGFLRKIKSVCANCDSGSYLRHEVSNLSVCSELLRRNRNGAKIERDIADKLESLHIAPPKTPAQQQKTPENRVRPKTRARTCK